MNKKVPPKIIGDHEKPASDYDSLAKQFEYHGFEIIFGMVFEYTNSGEKLLDLGIGTGLSSFLFKKSGLDIYGLDNSEEMLDICKKKNIARDLKLFDLNENIIPYNDREFHHVIAVGLFHFFNNLEKFFKESHRILKEGGIFSFTVKDSKTRISSELDKEYGIIVYGHSDEYIEELVQKYNFKLQKRLKFFAFKNLSKREYLCFKAYVLMKG
ncbi:MAG: class I SAM-dependent methyltransferase [Euryarchaeota archaeon]|nr:class I SAM-dependent methyltransferase [Euryarchaeota archaeon]